MAPDKGNNRVVFKLTDRFNNTTETEVLITREENITNQPIASPEYNRVISKKQIASFSSMLKSRATDRMLKVITDANIESKKFGKIDDYISYLKEEANKKGVSSEEVDNLALRVAVMDNILTQAAVDLLAKHTEGSLKKLLSDIDIYALNLKTWTDLQEYIRKMTGGKITPEDLNRIAAAVLAGIDPSIAILRTKILAYGENSTEGDIIRQSVAAVDQDNINTRDKWLQEFYHEAVKHGLTLPQISDLLAVISSLPDTKAEQYLNDLIVNSEEPFASLLKSTVLKKAGIKTPEDLIMYLLTNKDKYPEEAVIKSIANMIAANDISADNIKAHFKPAHTSYLWILWVLLGAGILFLFLLLWRRKRNKKK
jgi:hypothetical protein